jgi:hypothetical protein
MSLSGKSNPSLSVLLLHSGDGMACERQYLQLVEELILGLYNLQASWDESAREHNIPKQQTTRSQYIEKKLCLLLCA